MSLGVLIPGVEGSIPDLTTASTPLSYLSAVLVLGIVCACSISTGDGVCLLLSVGTCGGWWYTYTWEVCSLVS